MNNYGLFNKYELLYILQTPSKFDKFTIEEVRKYCIQKKITIEKLGTKMLEWSNDLDVRLNYYIRDDCLVISKTKAAKKADYRAHLSTIIGLGVILVVVPFGLKIQEFGSPNSIWTILVIPFLAIALYQLFKESKDLKALIVKEKQFEIFKTRETIVTENNQEQLKHQIKAINFFWGESDGYYNVVLKLKLKNGKSIKIDKSSNRYELFQVASKISKFLNIKMNVFYGHKRT